MLLRLDTIVGFKQREKRNNLASEEKPVKVQGNIQQDKVRLVSGQERKKSWEMQKGVIWIKTHVMLFFCRFIFITALFSSSSPYCMGTSGVRHMAEWSRSGYHMDIRGKMILAACPYSVSPNKQEASAEQGRSRMGWGTFGEVVVNDLIMIDDDMVSWRCYIMTVVRSGCGEGDDTGSEKLHKSR